MGSDHAHKLAAAGSARNDAAETTRRRGSTSEPPRLRLPLPDDDVFRRAVAEAHADGHAGLVGRLQPLAEAPGLDDAAPPGRALACGFAVASMAREAL